MSTKPTARSAERVKRQNPTKPKCQVLWILVSYGCRSESWIFQGAWSNKKPCLEAARELFSDNPYEIHRLTCGEPEKNDD